jgi:hypothetical protein
MKGVYLDISAGHAPGHERSLQEENYGISAIIAMQISINEERMGVHIITASEHT